MEDNAVNTSSTSVPNNFTSQIAEKPADPVKKPSGMKRKLIVLAILILFILVMAAIVVINFGTGYLTNFKPGLNNLITKEFNKGGKPRLVKFQSKEEFEEYISQSSPTDFYGMQGNLRSMEKAMDTALVPGANLEQAISETPQRYSATNIQVVNIDEPDIVKNNGKVIYYSSQSTFRNPIPLMDDVLSFESKIMPPFEPDNATKNIEAFPPQSLKILSEINKHGEMLINDNRLIILAGNWIYGYDVTDTSDPKEIWQYELEESSELVGARMFDNKLYLISKSFIVQSRPCVLPVFKSDKLSINCTDVYYPQNINIPADSIYSVLKLNPGSGTIEERNSFIGSLDANVIYMSQSAIFISYRFVDDPISYLINFMIQNSDLFSQATIDAVKNLSNLDISNQAKWVEYSIILEREYFGKTADDRLKIENEIANRMQSFSEKHVRELEKSAVVKLNPNTLAISATGEIPGVILNQYAMDEWEGNLRVATTTNIFSNPFGVSGKSVNDVYILDGDLDVRGSVTDLGLGENIYSARFIEDKGYIVTFKRIDPFYVLDLSNPRDPKKAGELKIPGYSSYLHPITKDKILGVGMEDQKVKISLFSVSDPSNPRELAKYNLDEYYTEVNNNPHAFLLDDKHKIFFLPGSEGGYIFSYDNDNLRLAKAVSSPQVERALYINDYLYLLSPDKVTVLDENSWETVKELGI
jgi:uncharacterized secreted protein with C-terminal beta-propeller domain